jgi:hypothetical protein
MRVDPRGPSAVIAALVLLAAVALCLIHVDTPGADDLCAGFGPPMQSFGLLALGPLGQFHAAPTTAYQMIPEDLSPPPPEA